MSSLPTIEFASKDVSAIETNIITTYQAIAGYELAPGDPRRLFLQALAAIVAQQRVLIDYAAKQNLLAYSEGDYLDYLGDRVNTPRIPAKAATTTIRYTLSAPQPQVVTIPAGNRQTPGQAITFATVKAQDVPAGATQIDILGQCTSVGALGNGWGPGQINKLVDPLPWISKVENLTTSAGGADIESDDSYRERIREAPESFSVAGPEGAYRYWAKSASTEIVDVAVYSPAAGEVVIRPLLQGGGIPGQVILDAVNAICNNRSIRPLTDQVSVLAPETVSYNVTLTYYISQDKATEALAIQSAVAQAITDYVNWQKGKLGRDVNPSELITRIVNAGAKRASITAPVFTHLEAYQVAIAGTLNVSYGGLESA